MSLSAMVRDERGRPPSAPYNAGAGGLRPIAGAEETRPGRGGREAATRAQPKFSPGIKGRGGGGPSPSGAERSGAGTGPGPLATLPSAQDPRPPTRTAAWDRTLRGLCPK